MAYVFTLVFLASLVLLIVGLFDAPKALFWKKSTSTRKQSVSVYSVAMLVSLIAIGMTAPDVPENALGKGQTDQSKTVIKQAVPMATPCLKKTDSAR